MTSKFPGTITSAPPKGSGVLKVFILSSLVSIGENKNNVFLPNVTKRYTVRGAFDNRIAGADPGEVKWVNFHPPPPPLFLSPLPSFFFSYPSNIEIIFDFSNIITKIHPPISKSWIRPCIERKSVVWVTSETILFFQRQHL